MDFSDNYPECKQPDIVTTLICPHFSKLCRIWFIKEYPLLK